MGTFLCWAAILLGVAGLVTSYVRYISWATAAQFNEYQSETWTAAEFRWQKRVECGCQQKVLQQCWVSSKGKREWCDVPSVCKSDEEVTK